MPPPFWLMRQAGRYLPEYRALRATAGGFLDLCYNADFAAEVTLQPLRRFDMDAAIIFSDILVVPHALGQDLTFGAGEGPRLPPLRDPKDFARLDPARLSSHLQPLCRALQQVRAALPQTKALIGFVGAPWTVACYMVEGQGGDFTAARQLARDNPAFFQDIIDLVVMASIESLCLQIAAGADAVQIFDSWSGLLEDDSDFMRWSVLPTQKIVSGVRARFPHVPVIGFPRGCDVQVARERHLRYVRETGVTAIGIDHETDLQRVAQSLPADICVQGNLDPQVLLQGGDRLLQDVRHILGVAATRPFIFNLGHGVIKETPPEHVATLAQLLRGADA